MERLCDFLFIVFGSLFIGVGFHLHSGYLISVGVFVVSTGLYYAP